MTLTCQAFTGLPGEDVDFLFYLFYSFFIVLFSLPFVPPLLSSTSTHPEALQGSMFKCQVVTLQFLYPGDTQPCGASLRGPADGVGSQALKL